MLSTLHYRLLVGLGVVLLALAGLDGYLKFSNRSTQRSVLQRQQYLQETAQIDALYRDMVKALADLALRHHDSDLVGMLATHGIHINPAPAAPAAAAASAK